MSALDARLSVELKALRAKNLYRIRRIVEGRQGPLLTVDGRACVNFCSNDYLGLAGDARVAAAAQRVLAESGTGSGGSALVSGYHQWHRGLEEALAEFTGRPRALLFSSGWAANLGVMRALLDRRDLLVADELNHASLIDGGRLSGATYLRVPHGDVRAFERTLQCRTPQQQVLVATDSMFSMDGDLAPLPELAEVCARNGAALMVDDAHGFGVLGTSGRGALEHFFPNPESRIQSPEIYVATLGKALGAAGAFVAGSETLIEYLVQRARSWVFSTAPPPALAAAALEALRIVQSEPERREHLFKLIRRFRAGCEQLDIPLGVNAELRIPNPESRGVTPIQPLILGDERRALALSQHLFANGWWVAAIRPPTVPAGTARLRITFSAAHTAEQVDGLLEAIAGGLRELARLDAAA
jgi:8-amino-7-oxononanoate synthase